MTGRYAPSPTGALHLGNLRTALAAWLLARAAGSRFLLRIDDLDPARCRREYELGQLEDLRRLGLDWDGQPVRQSERDKLYRAAFARLREQERVYPCWCTRAEVRRVSSAPHMGEEASGAYPGTCRRLTPTECAARERELGHPRAWRLDARAARIDFEDLVHGHVQGVVDDFVVWRGDGVAAYNLAVVVDDAEQGVQEVVRGDDLLAGTPRQLLLGALLELPAPRYAHVPLVLGPDGRRLAKRDGAVTLAERLARGEDPGQVVAWMALGLGLETAAESLAPRQLLAGFERARLSRRPTVLDPSVPLLRGLSVKRPN